MLDIYQLLNHGTGTAISILFVLFTIHIMNKMVDTQTQAINKIAQTLTEVSGTMKVIQDNIKDLQTGQNALWREIRYLKGGGE